MPDEQTMKDHIEDLMYERNDLLRQVSLWRKVAEQAFTKADGHIEPCLKACMCNCGYEQFHALTSIHNQEKK